MQATGAELSACAREVGLGLVGATTAEPFARGARVALERLRDGLMGDMPWYTPGRILRGADPRTLLPGARSVIVVAAGYAAHAPPAPEGHPPKPWGRVARYAWGSDYHQALRRRLRQLMARLADRLGPSFQHRVYVDTGPMPEREVALRAGIGFFGKSANTLTSAGSWVLLGLAITNAEVEPGRPLAKSCGSCTACIDACPTGAIVAPYVLDSRRCIAYLTIENRGPIPRGLRPAIGDWIFGCDACQEACPVNAVRGAAGREDALSLGLRNPAIDPVEVLGMDEAGFRERFLGSAVRRARWEGLQRNACVVLGNRGNGAAAPALARALEAGPALVRGHAAWALGRIGGEAAERALSRALAAEMDPWVREEVTAAAGMTTRRLGQGLLGDQP